jgi:hypothetical protein
MARVDTAAVLRALLVAVGVAAVLFTVVQGGSELIDSRLLRLILPFLAVFLASIAMLVAWPHVVRLVTRVASGSPLSPYSALAEAARRIQAGTLEQVLPGLAQVLAEGTGAVRAVVWLAVGDRLMAVAAHPPSGDGDGGAEPGRAVPGLADLLADPDTDCVVPVLDAGVLRAALAISKPGLITVADRQLLHDVANGATLLLRAVALNAELSERVRRAAELAEELRASRERLD